MKLTKIMLAFIGTIILTWIFLGLIAWFLTDLSFKEAMREFHVLTIMFVIGWVPAVVVAADLNDNILN